jgi:predicted TIM-barrel fold metal-dependent hydrolase
MPDYYPFHPTPRKPSKAPPQGTIDSQFHVLGPADIYPVRPGAAYEMPSATWHAARRMHDALGINRGVIVQATTYGADHQVVLDALAALGSGYKGCANVAVLVERDDKYVAKLHEAGIRGARFTRGGLGISVSGKDFDRVLGRIRELGWYIKVQPEVNGFAEQAPSFEKLELPVVIDHMGRPDPRKGMADPSLAKVVELVKRPNFWVMLSLGEKIATAGPPWDDAIAVARACIEAAPDRVIWGSDWPHPVSKKPPPNDAELIELLYRYAPDDDTLERILVHNPARLFGFAP